MDYNLGVSAHHKCLQVCSKCFRNVYGIHRTQFYGIRHQVRLGLMESHAGNQDVDGSGRESLKNNPNFVHSLVDFAKRRGIVLDRYQMASLAVPNTAASLTMFAWMDDYFMLVGQVEPNGHDVELENNPMQEIYEEYMIDLDLAGLRSSVLSMASFINMWQECFPHVKRRSYIGVCGKCHTCAALGIARGKHQLRHEREQLKMLHAFHRMGFMSERLSYYDRRQEAIQMPSQYLSIITDGMAQAHCQLPYYANVDQGESLTQHIQGVMAHGRFTNIYRTFHNTFNAANMQIHTLLLSLEDVYREEKRLPDTVFLQIDGGVENTSKSVIAMCELLVARGLTKRIILSRLMVGHTHEDIDGRFAKIWTRIRNAYVLTMSHYKENIEAALSREDLPCKVHDLFAIPDYDSFVRPFIDKKFGRYAKRKGEKDWTVLQFSFEAVDDKSAERPFFPLGVKTSWRPFAADKHCRIVKDPHSTCGMTVDELGPIKWMPLADERKGMHNLNILLIIYNITYDYDRNSSRDVSFARVSGYGRHSTGTIHPRITK